MHDRPTMKNKLPAEKTLLMLSAPACCAQLRELLCANAVFAGFKILNDSKLPPPDAPPPDALLVDYNLKNSLELCRKAKESKNLAKTPLLALLPTDSSSDLRISTLFAGADMLAEIPCSGAEELEAKLEYLLREGRNPHGPEERARLEWLMDASEDALLMLDNRQRVLYANPKARIYLEQSSGSDRLEGQNFIAASKQQYRLEPEEAWQNWPSTPHTPGAKRFLVRQETQQARAFWLEVAELPSYDRSGTMLRLKNVTKQVTFFRNMHSFNVLVSHKLRTPVNQILLSAQLADTAQPPDLDKFHKLIIDGAQKMRDQVEEILAYIAEDAVSRPSVPFGVKNLRALTEALAERFNISNFSIEIDKKAEDAHLSMGRASLELALAELFRNSVKYHTSRSPEMQLKLARRDNYALLTVSDDGQNLSPDQLEMAFTPYWQGEKFFTGQLDGMGLGLSLVRILLREAGGRCRFCNNPKRNGVRVELYIPLLPQ